MSLKAVLDEREIDPVLAGVCGIYCGTCEVYRAWVAQDRERLLEIAGARGVPVDRVLCTGCRMPGNFCFVGACPIRSCAESKGLAFCADCPEFPCAKIERAAEVAPGRVAVVQNGSRIRAIGWYAWLREQDARWRCPACHAKVAARDAACRTCGTVLGIP